MDYLTPDKIFFTVLDYEMSYIEFFGTLFNLASVWLVVRRHVLTWPVGIAGVALFGLLFYQIELYSDFVEQVYFLVTGFYGWWLWSSRSAPSRQGSVIAISLLTNRARMTVAALVGGGTLVLGIFMSHIHELLPRLVPTPAALPFLDAFTTVMSFAAQILMAHKRLESWLLWIAVDVIGIWLYYDRDVLFISLLYVVFLVMAIRGLFGWLRLSGLSDVSTRAVASPAVS